MMIAQHAAHKPALGFRPHTEIFRQFPAVGCHASALRYWLLVYSRCDVNACLPAAYWWQPTAKCHLLLHRQAVLH